MNYLNGIPILPDDIDINHLLAGANAASDIAETKRLSPGLAKIAHSSAEIATSEMTMLFLVSGVHIELLLSESFLDTLTTMIEASIYTAFGAVYAAARKEAGEG